MMTIEFHQIKRKWLLLRVYKPPSQSDPEVTEEIIETLNHHIRSYENVLLLSDLNMTTEKLHLNNITQFFDLSALIKTSKSHQLHNPTCIDNILTNQKVL